VVRGVFAGDDVRAAAAAYAALFGDPAGTQAAAAGASTQP